MTRRVPRRIFAALLAIAAYGAIVACFGDASGGDRNVARTSASAKTGVADGVIDLGNTTYRVAELGAVGSVTGTITPPAGAAAVTAPALAPARVARRARRDTSTRLCDDTSRSAAGQRRAVVWIAGVSAGKAFPAEKRADLSSDDCDLAPQVQAVVVGTTVNVMNDDKVLHRFVFARDGRHDTLAIMPFFNAGEVVASERLAKVPGIVDATCALHPSTHGYIAVFGHPYFAVTDDAGRFTIDSLPPGMYRLMVWHEGAVRAIERSVTIAAGTASRVDVALEGR